jgi:hypothetical protein
MKMTDWKLPSEPICPKSMILKRSERKTDLIKIVKMSIVKNVVTLTVETRNYGMTSNKKVL